MAREDDPRIERRVHEAVNRASNAYGGVERAVSDARRFIYMVLDRDPDDTVKATAENWLENFGRDSLREAGRR